MHTQTTAPQRGQRIGEYIVAQIIGQDHKGHWWVQDMNGTPMMIAVKNTFLKGERRRLRLQRTMGWTITALMGLSYIVDKWIW